MTLAIANMNGGAYGTARLVRDDGDRHDLLRRVHETLGLTVLAYAVLDTHIHVIATGDDAPDRLESALAGYVRAFRRRNRDEAFRLRGPVDVRRVPARFELGRAIRYVHANPVRTTPPLAARPLDHPFSSQRAFVGLSLAPHAGMARALELLGPHAAAARCARPPLADLRPALVPGAPPELLLGAAAQTFEVDPVALREWGRDPRHLAARALYVRLGDLESYDHTQLAPTLGRTRQRVQQLASVAVPDLAVRIARTLVRDPGLRAALPALPPPPPPRRRDACATTGAR